MTVPALDLVVVNAHLATMLGETPYGAIRDGAVGVKKDRIAWIGTMRDLPHDLGDVQTLDAGGRWLTPGLVDCHTHLVYAGNRANEFAARLEGRTYEQIAKAGGGIAATVRDTRAASSDDLIAQSLPRLAALAKEGVTTVEISPATVSTWLTSARFCRRRVRWPRPSASMFARPCLPHMPCRRNTRARR
jgi:imidazolonepropionase